jgi:hypothetical protein
MQGYEIERISLERMYNAKYLILDDLGSGLFSAKTIESQKFLRNFFLNKKPEAQRLFRLV